MSARFAFRLWREAHRCTLRRLSWVQAAFDRAERAGSVITFGWPKF